MASVLVLFFAFAISLYTVAGIKRVATRFGIGALPNTRKIHSGFKPLLGGLGVLAGLLGGMFLAVALDILDIPAMLRYRHIGVGLFIIVLVGLVDDVKGLRPGAKFLGQFLAAAVAAYGGCFIEAFFSPSGAQLDLGVLNYPFTILWIMFIINAVNLLDGLDGLAGGISLITMAGFFILSVYQGNLFLVVLSLALIGALLGFLKHNYHPASIFMGDVGSLMLGYLLAVFSIESLRIANSHQVYFLVSLIMLGMPITDTLISFFRRMGRGSHPFKADREHIHHRLINLSLSHLDSVWLMYYFTMLYTVLGVLMVFYRELAGAFLFLLAFSFSIYWAWRLGYLETRQKISFGISEQQTRAAMRSPIHVNRIWHQIAIFLGDIAAINLAGYLTWWFRFRSGIILPASPRLWQDFFTEPVFLIITGVWLFLFWVNGLYRMPWDISRFNKSVRVTRIITFTLLLFLAGLNLDILVGQEARAPFNQAQLYTVGFYWLVMIIFVNGIRLLIIKWEKTRHIFEYSYKNTLVIGTGRKSRNILRDIRNNPHLLYRVIGIVDRKQKRHEFEGIPVLGTFEDLPDLIHQNMIEEIIVAVDKEPREDLLDIIGVCDRLQVVVKTPPVLHAMVSGHTSSLAEHGLTRVFPEPMVLWQWFLKRVIDITLAGSVLLLTLPLWTGLILLIRKRFQNSALVRIPILGKNGRIFNMYLFRLCNDDQISCDVYQGGGAETPLTPLGDFLYRTHLYKLPQLFNIIKGDMSWVGPRPESPEWYRQNFNRLPFLHRRVMVRPGISGFAQIKYRVNSSTKLLKERTKYENYYVENLSISLDIRIMLQSAMFFFRRKHRKGETAAFPGNGSNGKIKKKASAD